MFWLRFALFLSFLSATAQDFTAQPGLAIPDNNQQLTVTIPVSALPVVSGADFGLASVCLDIRYTSCMDVEARLQAPDGTAITLFSGVGWEEDNFQSTCLADTGVPIYQANTPLTGTFRSQGLLGTFNTGKNLNGSWKLLIRDRRQGNTGTVDRVTLSFSATPAEPFSFTGSALPLLIINGPEAGISDYFKSQATLRIIDNGPGAFNPVSQTNYAYNGPIMAEWQGWSSTNAAKKNIDFNLGPAENPTVEASLLGMPAENDWVLKAEFTDRTLLRNSLVYETFRTMGRYAPRTRYCEVIIDGEYAGVFVLLEKIKRGKDRLDIARLKPTDVSGDELTGGYILDMNPTGATPAWYSKYPPANDATTDFQVEFKHVYPRLNEIQPAQQAYIKNFVDQFESVLAGSDYLSPTAGYRAYINVPSFIDFLIINEWSGNYDSYGRSTYLYKEKITNGGKLHMGPPWDYDRTFGFDYPDTFGWVWEITNYYWPFPFWWQRLWSDPDFRQQTACRWRSYREEVLSDARVTARIDSLQSIIADAQQRNFKHWPDGTAYSWNSRVADLKTFITARMTWIDNELASTGLILPDFPLATELQLCAGTRFDAAVPDKAYSYNWRPGPDSSAIRFNRSGVYELEVSDAGGCFRRKKTTITAWSPDASITAVATAGNSEWSFQAPAGQTSYSWDFGDGSTAGGPSTAHSFAANGEYVVRLNVTDDHGCTSEQTAALTVNSAGIGKSQMAVFPNPSDGLFTLVAGEKLYGTGWVLADPAGAVHARGRVAGVNTLIDGRTLAPGWYFLKAGNRTTRLLRY